MSPEDFDHEAIRLALEAIRWRLEGIQRELRAMRAADQAQQPLPAEVLARWMPAKAGPRT